MKYYNMKIKIKMAVKLRIDKNEAEIKSDGVSGLVQEIDKGRYSVSIVKDGKIYRWGDFNLYRAAIRKAMKEIAEIQIERVQL
jgi:uncharacterized protein (DUF2141 family)